MSKVKNIAIIGGGVSGLSAGGLLSRNGMRVKLYEANDKLGGCCATSNIGGYTFNDGALYLALLGILDHVFEKLNLNRSTLLPLRKIISNQSTTLPDGTVVTFGDGLDVSIKRGANELKGNGLQQELNNMMKKWEPVLRVFADDILLHPFSFSRLIAKGWWHIPKFRGTVASEINKFFSDEAVKAAVSGVLLFTGIPPDKTPVQSILGFVALLSEGFYLPEGGMGKIPEVLSQSLKNNGGEIFLNSKIKKIIVKNGRACGLDVDGQGIIEFDAVVSSVSGMLTYGSLLDPRDVPESMKRKVQKSPLSHKAFAVQMGLSNSLDVDTHMNSILPWMNEQDKVFIPTEDDVKWPIYSVPTMTMPELAQQGGSIIEMYPPIKQDMAVEDWDEEKKNKITETSIKALSRIHNINIAVRRVLSPKDFQNRLHLYKGAVYGLSPTANPSVLFPYISPIPGLYQTGQTTYPGYGVGPAAMSGILSAEALMKNEGK